MISEPDRRGHERSAVEAACLRYLAQREHTREELRLKLRRDGYPPIGIEAVIADFHERGLQSDARFAEVFSRSCASRGYGPRRIRQNLRLRGVSDEDAAGLDSLDWEARIAQAHGRKFGDLPPHALEDRARRERFLIRRGFSGDQIRRLFHRLREASGDM